ncbi:MAG: SIMPL domain-containing protein [Clostridia bacterium]|nr:SIMPL domain-containing protein [Clostridia bacterium]
MSNKKVISAALLVVLTVFMVSGCGTQTNVVTSEMPQIIQTYGEAEVKAESDLARVGIAVETRGSVAEAAVEENARLANAVIEALKEFGLAEEDIKTGSYSLYSYREWFDERPADEEVITYQVTNEIVVTTTRLEEVGEMIDLAVKAGANNINYINFELENPQELQLQALKLATEQAAKKAEAIAESSGEKISGLYRIREERTEYMPYVYKQEVAADMGMGAPTPIIPDEVVVTAMVTAEFSF